MHFRGNHAKPVGARDLAACVQRDGEMLANYTRRFIHLKCQVSDIHDATVIESVAKGLRMGAARSAIRVKQPQTLDQLLSILEG